MLVNTYWIDLFCGAGGTSTGIHLAGQKVIACKTPNGPRNEHDGYSTITIDGCEYIEVNWCAGYSYGYYSLTHKGNCKNHIHNCK